MCPHLDSDKWFVKGLLPAALSIAVCLSGGTWLAAAEDEQVAELVKELEVLQLSDRIAAIDNLGDLGIDAKDAVPALSKLLTDKEEDVRWHTVRALGSIGTAAAGAAPAVAERLADKSASVRAYAAFALGRMGDASKPFLPSLVKGIKDPERIVRRECVKAVRILRPGPEVAVPLFVDMLRSASPGEVVPALNALAESGKAVVPQMQEALRSYPEARYWACLILAEIGPEAKEAVPDLMGALNDADVEIRREALAALGRIGANAKPAVPSMVSALQDKDLGVRYTAAYALGLIGPDAAGAITALHKLGNENDELLRVVSGWALTRVEPQNAPARQHVVAVCLQLVRQKNPRVRAAVVSVLADLYKGEPQITSALIESLADNDVSVIVTASNALHSQGEVALPALTKALDRKELRVPAAATIGRLGEKGESAVPALLKALQDPQPEVRREVVLAIANIGPPATGAVSALLGRLESDADFRVRRDAAYALGQIASENQTVAAALKKALHDKDPDVREASQEALKRQSQR